MAYKTIMVSLNEVDRVESLLDFAIEAADYQNAHVVGLYVIPAVQVYPSVAIDLSPQIFEAYRNFFKRHAHQVKETFRDPNAPDWSAIRMVPDSRRDTAGG